MIIMVLLGIIDVIAALMLLGDFAGGLAGIIGFIILLKGLYSFVTSLMSRFPFDLLGIIDIAAGVALMTSVQLNWLWIPLILKGGYSLLIGFVMK